jgi:Zn-dependent oligopeptidase
MNEKLAQMVLTVKACNEQLSKEDQRLLERLERDFRRNGFGCTPEERLKLQALKKRLTDVCLEFQSELTEDQTTIEFTESELEGVSKDFLDSLQVVGETKEGCEKRYRLTMKYPDLLPVMRSASREETRFRMDQTNGTRCVSNLDRLKEVSKKKESV